MHENWTRALKKTFRTYSKQISSFSFARVNFSSSLAGELGFSEYLLFTSPLLSSKVWADLLFYFGDELW